MAQREAWMPIGRFSRCCRLGVKALRHYDEEGLLLPAHVDPQTGYRYYARHQAREAVMIGMLRSLGVGLAAIREILAAPAGAQQALLEREAARAERALAEQQRALASLRQLARAGLAPYAVEIRREPAVRVARRSVVTRIERLVPDTSDLVYALLDDLRAAGLPEREPVLCMNEEPDGEERLVVHACAGLAPEAAAPPGIETSELPAGEFAWLRHVGPYESLGLAHHALAAWVQERGHEPRGLAREIYRNGPREAPPEALVTEIWLPI